MDKIEIKILNPSAISDAEQMMVCSARLTQRGPTIQTMDDFMALYQKEYTDTTVENLGALPHPTIQKFGVINIVVVGASRRFLAQITRHQNEVKFMSASLQYSDYSDGAGYVVPYELLENSMAKDKFLLQCTLAMQEYESMKLQGIDHDSAGYIAPQALRNVLIISATPYQWKHMIAQRTCRRNTLETRYVMLKIWEALYQENAALFSKCGPYCMKGGIYGGLCKEGKMSCGRPLSQYMTPTEVLKQDFPKLYK
jgi:thymidylate synthase (FAD)